MLTRFLGKKQISHITLFNYITGITFGSIAASTAVDTQIPAKNGLISLVLWTVLTFCVGKLSLKYPKARIMLDGEPTIIIKNGKILEKAMASMHLNMDDVSMLLREKNVFSISEVDYAILEPHGELSVLKKAEHENVTKKDMQVPLPPNLYMPTEIIVDGAVVTRNLNELNLSMEWLETELRKTGNALSQLDRIFYAELQRDGSLHVDKRNDLAK
ncbi:DUF421 domain-containing protein [Paenibacillus ginsengarvi]|uniref:DUF421 domain-containing protein n=1 Tax=Paenibacillus ginsengarvi TaxID=400777 RepID=A0A3B0CJ46_9BACL|nr:DUF421 domain-containing protein [Paenibacillus ginsengarvi]